MTSYTVDRAKHATLVATQVDTVNFSQSAGTVRIINRSSSVDIYVRLDGTAPTILGDDCFVVTPGTAKEIGPASVESPVVKLISGGIPSYSCET